MRSRMFLEPNEAPEEKQLQVIIINQKNSNILIKQMTFVPAAVVEEVQRYRKRKRVVGAHIVNHIPSNGYIIVDRLNLKVTYIDTDKETYIVATDDEYDILVSLLYEYGSVIRTLSDEREDKPKLIENRKEKRAIKRQIRKFKRCLRGITMDSPSVVCLNKDNLENSYCVYRNYIYGLDYAVVNILKVMDSEIELLAISNEKDYLWVVLKGKKVMHLQLTSEVREKIWNRVRSGYCTGQEYS